MPGLARHPFTKGLAVQKLRDLIEPAVALSEVVDRKNVGVRQRGECTRLRLETGDTTRVDRNGVGEDLTATCAPDACPGP